MVNQSFTLKQFKYLIRQGDYNTYFQAFSREDKEALVDNILLQVESRVSLKKHQFLSLKRTTISGKTTYSLPKITAENKQDVAFSDFVLRKVNHILKRVFKAQQEDRYQIVAHVVSLLRQPYPYYVYKLDIKDFYESINRDKLLSYLRGSMVLSQETKEYLGLFFSSLEMGQGIPRGVNISATLSEIYMRKFDRFIKALPGVFYYARFVDDMIIFSTREFSNGERDSIKEKLPEGLSLNEEKSRLLARPNQDWEIEYLGYAFKYAKPPKSGELRDISITIAPKKSVKIKEKIVRAFANFSKKRDFSLLQDRLIFLSATYPLKTSRKRISRYDSRGELHGGIAYNYPLINDMACLVELDNFFHTVLSAKGFERLNRSLSKDERKKLQKISFRQGYEMKIKKVFSVKRLGEITQCWKV